MKVSTKVEKRIQSYLPEGGLDQTARVLLKMSEVKHLYVKGHMERVALLTEEVARVLKKDTKAAFFGGLLHDTGKIVLPYPLYDGHNINKMEFEEVKTHALVGLEILRELHLFTACCAGLHHTLYKNGYGMTMKDFPKEWSVDTVRKVLDISVIISICDYVDATRRATKIKDGSGGKNLTIRQALREKFPNDYNTIDIALRINKEMNM